MTIILMDRDINTTFFEVNFNRNLLLSLTLLISSLSFDDILGQTFATLFLTISGEESAQLNISSCLYFNNLP
jgi:hypothetical protein